MSATMLGSRSLAQNPGAVRSRHPPQQPYHSADVRQLSGVASTSDRPWGSVGIGGSSNPSSTMRRHACIARAKGGGGKRKKAGRAKEPSESPKGTAYMQPLKTKFSTSMGWPEFTYDRYQLGNIVGQGSYGDVFEALDTENKVVVAVKRMTKFRDSNSVEKTLFKLSREVSLLRLMQDSPYTIHLFDALEDDYSVYIVTEICTGGDLEDLIATYDNRIVPEADLARCIRQVLEFLQGCHDQSVCFGDVKPSNFMLQNTIREGRPILVKAIDFGCSQRIHDNVPLQIRMGTPIFFAPEVFQKWYGVESDCWSVGIMMYLMLTGSFPFWTDTELATLVPQDVMQRVLNDEIKYPDEIWGKLSPEANDLVRALLEKDKFKRISATDALGHPWFQKYSSISERLKKPPPRLMNNIVTKAAEGQGEGAKDTSIGAMSGKPRTSK